MDVPVGNVLEVSLMEDLLDRKLRAFSHFREQLCAKLYRGLLARPGRSVKSAGGDRRNPVPASELLGWFQAVPFADSIKAYFDF